MSSSTRKHLAAQLKPLLPANWQILPYQTNIDRPSRPVVMIKSSSISPTPSAPRSAHNVEFLVTVIEPATSPEIAEDALDDEIDALIYALDAIDSLIWKSAERVVFEANSGQFQAWDLAITVTTTRN